MSLPKGLGAREHAKFRATRHGEVAVGITNEDEALIETLNVTASGDTEILPSPGATDYLTIKGFHFSNNDSSKVTVSLKAGAGAKELFSTVLTANGGNFDKNLIGRYWRLPLGKELLVNLSGASDVLVTVEYEGVDEPGQEAKYLTDTISIAESLAKDVSTPSVADSQTIAESVAKGSEKPVNDSISMSESLIITGDRSKSLSDGVPIVESMGNSASAKLSDTMAVAGSVEVTLIPE